MARGEIFVASAALLLLCLSALVNGIDAENLFPTYEDNAEEQARVGVISLTGSTSNTTLNLSGLVILGLSLSAAVSFWAYTLSALEKTPFANLFNNPTGKRSLDDSQDISLPIVLNNIQRRFENARVFETDCRQRIICEIGTGQTKFLENSFGHNVNTFFGLNEASKTLKKLSETDKWAKTYLEAWNEGKRGKMCKVAYDKCSMTRDSIDGLIGSE